MKSLENSGILRGRKKVSFATWYEAKRAFQLFEPRLAPLGASFGASLRRPPTESEGFYGTSLVEILRISARPFFRPNKIPTREKRGGIFTYQIFIRGL
jgi:hypothetical protein